MISKGVVNLVAMTVLTAGFGHFFGYAGQLASLALDPDSRFQFAAPLGRFAAFGGVRHILASAAGCSGSR